MHPNRITGIAAILLGLGAAMSAILGPLVLGVIDFRVSDNAENQLVGGEIVSLLAVAPLAILAGLLWLRGHRLAPALTIGPAGYAVYTYTQMILGPEYARYEGNNEYAFPLFLALVILGWALVVRAWAGLSAADLPAFPARLSRALAVSLIFVGVVFALLWAGSIMNVLSGDSLPQEYQDDPNLFWLVRFMDLAFVIPGALLTAVGLLRRASWASKLGYAFSGFLTLEIGAVAGMAVAMTLRDDPSASPVLLVATLVMTVALATLYALLLRNAVQPSAPRPAQNRVPAGMAG